MFTFCVGLGGNHICPAPQATLVVHHKEESVRFAVDTVRLNWQLYLIFPPAIKKQFGAAESEESQMSKPGFKECPMCAELIREKAKLCRYCGAILTNEPLPALGPQEERARAIEFNDGIDTRYTDIISELTRQHQSRLEGFLRGTEEQYRNATILFVDINGYTEMCEALRAEQIKEILDNYYTICTHMVDFYNGFVLEFQGDGCLAVFGAPVAYDRDAESAVRAALEIRERVEALPSMHGRKIRVSAGIETGTVLSSVIRSKKPAQYKIFGSAVNLAARVESAASAGQILIGPGTEELVNEVFSLKKRAPRKFKNVSKTTVTYEVVGLKNGDSVRRNFGLHFVGRRPEMEKLQIVWDEFLAAAKTARTIPTQYAGAVISGEAGIGKTRLAKEFAAPRAGHANSVQVDSAPYDVKVPWGMWRRIIAAIAGLPAESTDEKVQRGLRKVMERLAIAPEDHQAIAAIFGNPHAVAWASGLHNGSLRRTFASELRTFLERTASSQRMILLLDDIQWADGTSLEILDSLLADPPAGVFFLIAHRSDYTLQYANLKKLNQIKLRGLDQKSREALFSLATDVREILPEIRQRVTEQTAGNPFYMIELARTIVKNTKQVGEGPDMHHIPDLGELVPASLTQLLQSRIDSLDDRRKLVLQCAAVLGKRFSLQLIEFFNFIRDGLLTRLYSLKSVELLDDAVTRQGLEFFFQHHVTREVAYKTLLDKQRRELHKFVAEQIEQRYRSNLSEHAALLAFHFSQADVGDRAIHYLEMAGDQAYAIGGLQEAIAHYSDAVWRLRQGGDTKSQSARLASLLRKRGKAHRIRGEARTAIELLVEARDLFIKIKDVTLAARTGVDLAMALVDIGDYAEADSALNQALPDAQRQKEAQLLSEVWNAQGMSAWGRGDYKKARQHFEKVTASSNDKNVSISIKADAENNLALLDWKDGRLADANKRFKRALTLRRRANDKINTAVTLLNLGITEENMGNYSSSERLYANALEMAERVHYQQVQTATHANIANLHLAQQQSSDALVHSAKAFEIAERIGDRRSAAIANENMALSHLGLNNFVKSRECLKEALRAAKELGDKERELSLDLLAIELALGQEKAAQTDKQLQKAHKDLDRLGLESERPRLLRLTAMSYHKQNSTKEALKLASAAMDFARQQRNRTEEARARDLLTALKR